MYGDTFSIGDRVAYLDDGPGGVPGTVVGFDTEGHTLYYVVHFDDDDETFSDSYHPAQLRKL